MTTVNMTSGVVEQIAHQAGEIVRTTRSKPPAYPTKLPDDVADEAFSLIMPRETEEKVMALLPPWSLCKAGDYGSYIGIETSIKHYKLQSTLDYRYPAALYGAYKKDHLWLPHSHIIEVGMPGIKTVTWNGASMLIVPADDGSVIQQPALKGYVDHVVSIQTHIQDTADQISKAKEDMANFLSRHRTLQAAAKELGPVIWDFVPEHIQNIYNAKPEPRVRKPKEDLPEVNIDYLIAKATSHKLQLNT